VRRLGWSLQRLDATDRVALTDEIRSHLTDSAGGGDDALTRAIAGLGTPYALGRRFVEEYELAGAVTASGPWRLLGALAGRTSRRAAGTGAAFAAMLCYLFALVFALIAVAKPFAPGHVGLWRVEGGWNAGLVAAAPPPPELLGIWSIPLALAAALASYAVGTMVLRRIGSRLLRS
jgi:hypothetical protein